jgi:hypothetical protein
MSLSLLPAYQQALPALLCISGIGGMAGDLDLYSRTTQEAAASRVLKDETELALIEAADGC